MLNFTASQVVSMQLVWRAAAGLVLLLGALPVRGQNQLWIEQFGTVDDDLALGAAHDGSGGVFVSGKTTGSLAAPNMGAEDAWFARFESTGNALWIRQVGTTAYDGAHAITADGVDGAFSCGLTNGDLAGPNAGSYDVWVARLDGLGNQLWIRQFGTGAYENATAVVPSDSGGVFVAGYSAGSLGGLNMGSHDPWIAKFDGAGNQLWIQQFGTSSNDITWTAVPDGMGGVYVGGSTEGPLGGPNLGSWDAWLARFDSAGNKHWIKQLGTSGFEEALAAAPDGTGGIFLVGRTGSDLGGPNAGGSDIWLARYAGSGGQLWIRQFGSSGSESVGVGAATSDGSGGVYLGGRTGYDSSLGGPSAGSYDAWMGYYDSVGNQTWLHQLGTSGSDDVRLAAHDGAGGLYVGGITDGSLGGPLSGVHDAWLARYTESPNYEDADGDGYGSATIVCYGNACSTGTSLLTGDCDDTNPLINPGATEVCDGVDNNCNGTIDEEIGAPDCNGNGASDACDIALGTSNDFNADGIPDECQCADPYAYCDALVNSTGKAASIGYTGSTSLTLNDLNLTVTDGIPNQIGIFFMGSFQTQVPFGDGNLCVTGNIQRLMPPVLMDAAGAGSFTADFTNPSSPLSMVQPLSETNFQFWYRDPQPIGNGYNLTDALHVQFCP